jgi:hypothetical protein
MNNFENILPDKVCEDYFEKMFGNIFNQSLLSDILFPAGFQQSQAYKNFIEKNNGKETELQFLAGFFGDSLWDIFSNNHSVVTQDGVEFDIGSWRGSGGFIADFINKKLSRNYFNYMDFYMGHFHENKELKSGYQFIFSKLKEFNFDWHYEYPSIGVVDFSQPEKDNPDTYNPSEAVEKEIAAQQLLNEIENINNEMKEKIINSPTPAIIIAYANVFGKYPNGWID